MGTWPPSSCVYCLYSPLTLPQSLCHSTNASQQYPFHFSYSRSRLPPTRHAWRLLRLPRLFRAGNSRLHPLPRLSLLPMSRAHPSQAQRPSVSFSPRELHHLHLLTDSTSSGRLMLAAYTVLVWRQRWVRDSQATSNAQFQELSDLIHGDVTAALSKLRPDVAFTLDVVPQLDNPRQWLHLMGCYNAHIPITFADGAKWFARIRFEYKFSFGDEAFELTAGDVATTRTAHALAPNLVPRVHIPVDQDGERLLRAGLLMQQCIHSRSSSWRQRGAVGCRSRPPGQ